MSDFLERISEITGYMPDDPDMDREPGEHDDLLLLTAAAQSLADKGAQFIDPSDLIPLVPARFHERLRRSVFMLIRAPSGYRPMLRLDVQRARDAGSLSAEMLGRFQEAVRVEMRRGDMSAVSDLLKELIGDLVEADKRSGQT